jgi:hypothetical protein
MIAWYWWIAIFIGLILLQRMVFLIATAGSLRWSKLQQSAMYLNGQNWKKESLSERSSKGITFAPSEEYQDYYSTEINQNKPGILPGYSFTDEKGFGSTGTSPGGVPYTQAPSGVRIGNSHRGFRQLMRMKGSR